MHFSTASEWLSWIATIHINEIELGLERVRSVAQRLDLLAPSCPVIIVGGTNGKGSTVAGLESIYRAAGYRTGAFTSPFLFKHNEQVRVNGKDTDDTAFCAAFTKIEETRGDIPLTPFEYHTLAALLIFQTAKLDVMLLEVGMGGRLDAVNIIDADLAIVTSISLDHTEWLGSTLDAIAHEKAGIFRKDKPALIGAADAPPRLLDDALLIGAHPYRQGVDFHYHEDQTGWSWTSRQQSYANLPLTRLMTQNMATVLMAVTLLQERLPVARAAIDQGLATVNLPGRIQMFPGTVLKIVDVSHNEASVALLAARLRTLPCSGNTLAVFSMLMDKDMVGSIKKISDCIDQWYVAPLMVKRGASAEMLQSALQSGSAKQYKLFTTIQEAFNIAQQTAKPGDRIVVFGSFHTVATVWEDKST